MSDNDNDRGLGFALALVLLVLLVLLVSQAGISNSFNTTVYCLGYCSW